VSTIFSGFWILQIQIILILEKLHKKGRAKTETCLINVLFLISFHKCFLMSHKTYPLYARDAPFRHKIKKLVETPKDTRGIKLSVRSGVVESENIFHH